MFIDKRDGSMTRLVMANWKRVLAELGPRFERTERDCPVHR
jgi:hypothetical protein